MSLAGKSAAPLLPDRPLTRSFLAAGSFPLRLFSQELAVLLGAGLSLLEAIETLCEKESQSHVSVALTQVAADLKKGLRLSEAAAGRPDCFDALFVAVVSAAERTGQLKPALASHAAYLSWAQELRSKLVSACIYPATLLVAGSAVLVFLLVGVVPKFSALLESQGSANLPAASALLIHIGRFTGDHGLLTLLLGALPVVVPGFLWRTSTVRARIERHIWRLPLLGDKLRLLALARLYRTLSMLLHAGVPLVPALKTTSRAVSAELQAGVDQTVLRVSQGERLSASLEQADLTTPVSLRMVRVGERSGELSAMLGQAAAFYDEELSRFSDILSKLVNPVLMLLMGGLIGSVIVLMYMPIFQLVEQVQ